MQTPQTQTPGEAAPGVGASVSAGQVLDLLPGSLTLCARLVKRAWRDGGVWAHLIPGGLPGFAMECSMRVPVHEQRDLLSRIHRQPDESNRSIGRAMGRSPTTVAAFRAAYLGSGLSFDELSGMDDPEFLKALNTEDRTSPKNKPAPDWNEVQRAMSSPNATLHEVWLAFREDNPGGLGYTQFALQYRTHLKRLDVVMRRPHVPGEKMYCDFAGQTVRIHDPEGGPGFEAQIFVSVLGYSNLAFARAVASQKVADWNACHCEAFAFYGGAPEWVVSDNLKAAIIRRSVEELLVNRAYRECLAHYGCHALPRGVRRPRQNAKGESTVQIVQRSILFPLRNNRYFSLEELNRDIDRLRDKLNGRPFKKLPGCRRTRFEEVERAALSALPEVPFEPREWRFDVLVGPDYVFEHGRCTYSVPYEFRGTRVDLRIAARTIEVMHRGKRIAIHEKAQVEGSVNVLPEHRPIAHTRVLEAEPRSLLSWAAQAGPSSRAMFDHHILQRADATNGLRTARRMRELARVHGDERFEEVCAYAMPLNMTSLKNVESILKSAADRRRREAGPAHISSTAHENVRGATYYGEHE